MVLDDATLSRAGVRGQKRRRARTAESAAVHAVMILAMVVSMGGPPSALASIASVFLLLAATLVLAPRARTDRSAWGHIADLWAMAVLILTMIPASGASESTSGVHTHGASVFSFAGVEWLILASWIGARLLLRRGLTGTGRLADEWPALLTGAQIVLMIIL